MKSFPKAALAALSVPLLLLSASLTRWAENVPASSPLESAFFRLMDVPGGAVPGRRSPAESRQQLTTLLNSNPTSALYSLRAREDERALDLKAAEQDWRSAADNAQDKTAALLDLAAYYHRQLKPVAEIQTRLAAARLQGSPEEHFVLPQKTRSWVAFETALQTAKEAQLPRSTFTQIYEEWLNRWPSDQQSIYVQYFTSTLEANDLSSARAVLVRYQTKFPDDWTQRLDFAERLAPSPEAKLAVYEHQFSPVWPDALLKRYFDLLKQTGRSSEFLTSSLAAEQSQPLSVEPVLRAAFYYEQSGQKDRAAQFIEAFVDRHEQAKANWTATDLSSIAEVLARLHDYDHEAKAWYTLYGLTQAPVADREKALAAVITLLLDVSEQPIEFESRDLSLYKNIATFDRVPGFLNGILSVALNTTFPSQEYDSAGKTAVAYFHRAGAAKLLDRLRQEFPTFTEDDDRLSAKLFAVYQTYGQDDTLLTRLPGYLATHQTSTKYSELALLLGDVYARKNQQRDEFDLYSRLLNQLSTKAEHMPLGPVERKPNGNHPRSADYARVLDRYLSRLTETHQLQQAITLFRGEINSNPDDPGLYERFALFVEQNRLDAEVEQTYRLALLKFPGTSWSERLARFYLRHRRTNDYQKLTQQLTGTFSGEELESYLKAVPPNAKLNPQLYLQINLYAHQRFPHHLLFVRNLLAAYSAKPTADIKSQEELLRQHWFYAADLKDRYLGLLSKQGRLQQMLASLPKTTASSTNSNTLALEFAGEGCAWLTRFEDAAPAFTALATLSPGDISSDNAAVSIHRSLNAYAEAAHFSEQALLGNPRSLENLTTLGELYADRNQFAKASPYWNRIPAIAPGEPQGYLDAATVFWDYFQYEDALRLIGEARHQLNNPALYAYEAGAIDENKNDLASAVNEYAAGALSATPAPAAEARLLRLGRRASTRQLVEQRTVASLNDGRGMAAFHLRLKVLEDQNRRSEEGTLLEAELAKQTTPEDVNEIRLTAGRLGFAQAEEKALERLITLRPDPVAKLSAHLDLANFFENQGNTAGAERELRSLLNDNPTILGVIHANTGFYVRTKQPAKAASVLEVAAKRAEPSFQKDLLREAVEREEDALDYGAARRNLDVLLAADPYNADLLASKADTWARQGDNTALAQFYSSELATLEQAPLPGQEKTSRVAGLRRGYILALMKLNKPNEALDQYIEVINHFPEDGALVTEAARYAENHQLSTRLTSFYEKTANNSPKDYRWPLVLARLDTALRKYPEAITAFEKASYVRPDRTDLLLAKSDLETRLLRFEDAIKTNAKLYDLTYKNTAYLSAQATLLARLGRDDEAIKMLRAALIDGRPYNQANYVNAATQLAEWNLFPQAQQTFEEGLKLTSDDPDLIPGYPVYLRILTIERKQDQAIQLVSAAVSQASQHKRDFASAPWMSEIGSTIDQYFTAEEKAQLAGSLISAGHTPANVSLRSLLANGQFGETYAQYLYQQALKRPALWQQLNEFQTARLRFADLGHQLEKIARLSSGPLQQPVLSAAFTAYQSAGANTEAIRFYQQHPELPLDASQYASVIASEPARYPARIPSSEAGNRVVQWIIEHASEKDAAMAIQARAAHGLPALWAPAYLALTSLYDSSPDTAARQAFAVLIGPRFVEAERRETAPQRSAHLIDDAWFYYAARYGDYLSYQKDEAATALLPAGVESAPAASERYVELGDTLRETSQPAKAREQYNYAQQINPGRADVLDRVAMLDIEAGNRSAAITNWEHAFDTLRTKIDAGPLPSSFWETARVLFVHLNHYGALPAVRAKADAMLRLYIQRNGGFQFTSFVNGILTESKDRQSAIQWITSLSQEQNAGDILEDLVHSPELKRTEREGLYRSLIERAQLTVARTAGDAQREARSELTRRRLDLEAYLESEKRYADAKRTLDSIEPPEDRPKTTRIRLDALTGILNNTIAGWKTTPETSPDENTLLMAASDLTALGKTAEANQLLEFDYTKQIDAGHPTSAAYFGLAKIRLGEKRTEEGLRLVRDAVLTQDAPFQNLEPAGKLLEDAGLANEAGNYYNDWRKAEPWNSEARFAAARLAGNIPELGAIRNTANASYATRIASAEAMRKADAPVAGPKELDVLTRKTIPFADASKPFFVRARLAAAEQENSAILKTRLYSDAIAWDPRLIAQRQLLADAAAQAKQDHLAVAAFVHKVPSPRDNDAPALQTARPYTSPAEIQTAERVASAYLRLKNDTQAQTLLNEILESEPNDPTRVRVRRLLDEVAMRLRLEEINAARSPEVSASVDQKRIVKPRLSKVPGADFIPTEGVVQ